MRLAAIILLCAAPVFGQSLFDCHAYYAETNGIAISSSPAAGSNYVSVTVGMDGVERLDVWDVPGIKRPEIADLPSIEATAAWLAAKAGKSAAQKVAEAQFKQICNMLQIQTPVAKGSFPVIIQTAIARFNSAPDQPTKDAIQNAMMQLHYLSGVLNDAIYAEDFGK